MKQIYQTATFTSLFLVYIIVGNYTSQFLFIKSPTSNGSVDITVGTHLRGRRTRRTASHNRVTAFDRPLGEILERLVDAPGTRTASLKWLLGVGRKSGIDEGNQREQ
jgi:hypothetical protein